MRKFVGKKPNKVVPLQGGESLSDLDPKLRNKEQSEGNNTLKVESQPLQQAEHEFHEVSLDDFPDEMFDQTKQSQLMDKFANMDGKAKGNQRRNARKSTDNRQNKNQVRAESVGTIMRNAATEKNVEVNNILQPQKSYREGRTSHFGRLNKQQFVSLEKEDILEVEKEMYREKMYHKFLNDPINMEKNLVKLAKRAKSKKPKHVQKATKIIDAMTAINNDSQRLLRYDVRHLFWKILIENYELSQKQMCNMWLLGSKASNIMLIDQEFNNNYYYILRDHNIDYPNPCFYQVELDLKRTFPNDPPDHVEKYIGSLRNVLNTFVKRNPTIGYCQGMNFIVGNLLKHLNEEESFWVFVQIVENMLPIDYYSHMLGILADQRIFNNLLTKKYPKLVAHMQNHNYQLDLIAFQWFVTLFFNSVNHETEKFIITAFLLKGQKILIRIALIIVDVFKEKIFKANDFLEIYKIFSEDPLTEITPQILGKHLKTKKLKITRRQLEDWREKVRPDIIAELQQSIQLNIDNKNSIERSKKFLNNFYLYRGLIKYYENKKKMMQGGLIKLSQEEDDKLTEYIKILTSNFQGNEAEVMRTFNCNPTWPICLFDFTYKNKSNEFQAMKCRKHLSNYIVEDYFSSDGVNPQTIQRYRDETDVVREHNTHLCQCLQQNRIQVKNYDFVKNFKICFIKEEEILYANENLIFKLEDENDIHLKKDNFIAEISGKVSDQSQVPGDQFKMMTVNGRFNSTATKQGAQIENTQTTEGKTDDKLSTLNDKSKKHQRANQSSVISSKQLQKLQSEYTHTLTTEPDGTEPGSPRHELRKTFKPSLNDLSLLIGMEEWPEVIKNEGLSNEIVAVLMNQKETMTNQRRQYQKNNLPKESITASQDQTKATHEFQNGTHEEEEENSVSVRRVEEEQIDMELTMGKVQFAIMQNLVQKVAEANQYDTQKIEELHRGSIVFRDELQGIVSQSTNIKEMQRQASEIGFNANFISSKTAGPNKLDIETEKWANQEALEDELEIPISDKGSDNDKDSEISFDGHQSYPDDSRKRVILSKSDIKGSPTLKFPAQEGAAHEQFGEMKDDPIQVVADNTDGTHNAPQISEKNDQFASIRKSFVVDYDEAWYNDELEELDNEVVHGRLEAGKDVPSYVPGQTKLQTNEMEPGRSKKK